MELRSLTQPRAASAAVLCRRPFPVAEFGAISARIVVELSEGALAETRRHAL